MKKKILFWLKVLYCYFPDSLKDFLGKEKKNRLIIKQVEFAKEHKVSKEESKKLIEKLPLGDCDVLLHSSMINIGTLQGGKKWISDNIIDVVDIKNNTLLTTAAPSLERNAVYLKNNPIFDVRTAPIGMGSINEYISKLDGARRSLHPTHSVVAIGKNADYYVSGQELDGTPFGVHSPYYKIICQRGKMLMFGATLSSATMIHAIEDMLGDAFPFRIYCKRKYNVKCIGYDNQEFLVKTPIHSTILGMKRSLEWMKDGLVNEGYMVELNLGGGTVSVIDAYGFAVYYFNQLLLGNSIYGHFKCTERLRNRINELLSEL